MEISKELEETLKKLSKVNLDFLEFVKENPKSLERDSFGALETSKFSDILQSWPTFINSQTKASFQEMGVKVGNLIKSLPARIFKNDPEKISAYFEQPDTVVTVQLEGVTDDHLDNLLGRVDFIFSSTGIKCVEFNISANIPGWQLPEWETLYLSVPILTKFIKERNVKIKNENYFGLYLKHIIRCSTHLASPGDNANKPTLNAVIVMPDIAETQQNKSLLLEELRELYREKLSADALSGCVYMCDYPEFEYKNNMVFLKGNRIHAIVEQFQGLVTPGVMNAFNAGNVRVLNGPVTGLLLNKLTLALLSENEDSDLFSEEERETIKKYIPWTRKIIPGETFYKGERIKMENFLISNKDRLVIKPSIGLGGHGVCIGQDSFSKQWGILVNTALRKRNFLVQELVEAPQLLYQRGDVGYALHDTVWGAWFLGSQYGAAFVRALPGGNARKVVNSGQGAVISAVLEAD